MNWRNRNIIIHWTISCIDLEVVRHEGALVHVNDVIR